MIKKVLLLIIFASSFWVLSPVAFAEDVLNNACSGTYGATKSTLCESNNDPQTTTNNSLYGPSGIITKAAGLVSILVGIAAIIVVIVGGIQYVMSTGDSAKVNQAKNTILYALIGLAVAALAQIIVIFVISKL